MKIKITGMVRLVIKDKNGKIKSDTGFMKNTIMNVAFAVFSGLAGNVGSQTAFTYLAVGTSSTAPAASQTALGGEISTNGLARASATVTRSTTTQANDTLQLDKTWSVSGSSTIEEIGVFNAASVGVMAGRKLTTTRSVINGDSVVATYKLIFS